ncbi:MAG: SDR family NAD(P)-dependent oxidoreductase [Actinobacteria bacterium]|nr:MAG: SDR family NAD(P)-dependent oxidoreductase [Actinomycetota bacterium]
MRTQGAAALVTGGASGLGEATVRRLAEAGAACTILDRNAERGKVLATELGSGAAFVEADVTDPEQVAAAVAAAGEAGPLRICVNCAGLGIAMRTVARDGTPHDLDAFRFVLNVNLIGTFNVLRLAASAMSGNEPVEDGERGVIVNTASVAAFDGQIGQIAYSASKGGIVSMTLTAARDLAAAGIRVVTVAPGTFDTPLMGFASQETKEGLAANIPFPRRMGDSREFAALVAHVVDNTYLNGETIRLDGAIRMPPK